MDDEFDQLRRPVSSGIHPAPPGESGLRRDEHDAEESSAVDRYSMFEQLRRGVRVGRLGIVLEPRMLYEVVESAPITPLPGVKPVFKGFVTHRSNVAPVYDLAELIDGVRPVWERKRLLILNSGREAVAMLLYELPFQIRTETPVEPDRIDEVPELFRRHTRALWRSHGTVWLGLNYEGFFTELSTLCLNTEPDPGLQTQVSGPADTEWPASILEY